MTPELALFLVPHQKMSSRNLSLQKQNISTVNLEKFCLECWLRMQCPYDKDCIENMHTVKRLTNPGSRNS